MTDAFRKGQIEANDVIERYSVLNKSKEKMQIQGIDEFLSPAAIAQRQQHASLMSDKDKSELALLPVAEQTKRAEYESIRIKAAQGDKASMREYAIKNGLGAELSAPTGGNYTPENAANDDRVYAAAVKYDQAVKSAADIVKDIKQVPNTRRFTGSDGSVEEDTDFNNPILTSETGKHIYTQEQSVKASKLARMTAQQHRAAGSPSADEYIFGIKPPEPQSNQPAVSGKVADLATPGKTITVEERKANGDSKTTRTVIEPTTHPDAPKSIADLGPGQTFKAAPILARQASTAKQDEAKLGIPRFEDAIEMMDELKTEGYNPAGNWESLTTFLPGPLKPELRQKFELAKYAFRQAIGRLESGAAIALTENKNYEIVFFPKWGDTEAIMREKDSLRAGVAAIAAEIATSGGVVTAEARSSADALRARANKIPVDAQAGGQPAERGSWDKKIIDLPGVGKGYYDATTKKFHPVQ